MTDVTNAQTRPSGSGGTTIGLRRVTEVFSLCTRPFAQRPGMRSLVSTTPSATSSRPSRMTSYVCGRITRTSRRVSVVCGTNVRLPGSSTSCGGPSPGPRTDWITGTPEPDRPSGHGRVGVCTPTTTRRPTVRLSTPAAPTLGRSLICTCVCATCLRHATTGARSCSPSKVVTHPFTDSFV